jgi:hypothetical protein
MAGMHLTIFLKQIPAISSTLAASLATLTLSALSFAAGLSGIVLYCFLKPFPERYLL